MYVTVEQLLRVKGREIWSVAPGATVFEALQLMAQKDVGAVLVIENGKLAGIFSERDYARNIVLKGKSSRDTTVGELMTQDVFYIKPQDSIQDCMQIMTSRRIRHLPVMDNGVLVGIVTIGDVVKQVISDQAVTIQDLEKYIRCGNLT